MGRSVQTLLYYFLFSTGVILLTNTSNNLYGQQFSETVTNQIVQTVNCDYPFALIEQTPFELSLSKEISTPYSKVYRYNYTLNGLQILDAQYVVKKSPNKCIVIASAPTSRQLLGDIEDGHNILIPSENGLIPVRAKEEGVNTMYVLDQDTILIRDRRRFSNDSLPATVFSPDPLTSSETQYGEIISDVDDGSTPEIFQEYSDVWITVDDNQELKNPWVWITEFSGEREGPYSPPYTSNRTESVFEAANAYFHLSAMVDRIKRLGYESVYIPQQAIQVDVNATLEDNSYFLSSPNLLQLAFGTGGVDDAEDADVVIHEFLHALSYIAAPGSNEGLVRRGIDEGLGDYLASSYSKQFSDYDWRKVFSWDGHNEYFQGRTNKNGQTLNIITDSSDIYSTSQLVGALLCDILEETSTDFTDQLVLELLPTLVPNLNFNSFSNLLMNTAEVIGSEDEQDVVISKLLNREFLDFPVQIGKSYAVLTNTAQINGTPRLYIAQDGRELFLELYNISGQLVWSSGKTQDKVIDLPSFNHLPSSVYVLILKSTLNETLFSETISVDNFR